MKLYRYESYDASRMIPNMNEIMKGKVEMSDSSVLSINAEKREIFADKNVQIYDRFVYFMN